MDAYQDYLAQHILTDDRLLTYRLLSRAMKVHVNTAKQMLYDFHKSQNERHPGSLIATYLVYGTRRSPDEQDGNVEMAESASNKDDPSTDPVRNRTLTVVQEEMLQETLQQYDEVTSIHVYSVAPHRLRDLQVLAESARQVFDMSIQEDLSASKTYGAILNPHTRKKVGHVGAPAPAPAPAKPQPEVQVKQEPKSTAREQQKVALAKDTKDSKPVPTTTAKKVSAPSASGMKRQASSSGIGQMFATAASKPKKPAAPKPEEPPAPALSDEGEDDSEAMPEAQQAGEEGKSRRDRQAELRRMMDESDEEEDASKSKAQSPAEEDPMEEDTASDEPEAKAEEGPAEVVASTGDGRRRGRRRVTKKKQIMDDQGYLVTIQEPGWESFSEEDVPAPKPKPAASEKAAPAGKAKKAAPKGQGNIMSFFSKK